MKKQSKSSENYILLPVSKTQVNQSESPKVAQFLTQLQPPAKTGDSVNLKKRSANPEDDISVTVLDSIANEGAKLITIDKNELADFRFSYPGLRIIPERFYRPAVAAQEKIKVQVKQQTATVTVNFTVTDPKKKGIEGVTVVVFTNFNARRGASGVTDRNGRLTLKLNSSKSDRIYMYPEHSYWGYLKKEVALTANLDIKLKPITLNYTDALRHFYDTDSWPGISQKVRVAVIDTGVGPHKNLPVSGGKNLVRGEGETNYSDNGEGHGTHVAGIIAAAGEIPGVATGVEIMSYRVFPKGEGASNFDIMKAIDQAIKDECDLINMSLGEAQSDEAISSFIKDAYNAGIICFAANGNEDRSPVSFPAAYSLAIAVSAMGRKGTFPGDSVQMGSIATPYGDAQENFFAEFSNIGPETDLTAPGVGIISTFPNNRYAVMDGTSMACPAAVGMAARILSQNPEILNLTRNQTRADEMIKYLSFYTKLLGFGANFEGKGMLYQNEELHPKIQRR